MVMDKQIIILIIMVISSHIIINHLNITGKRHTKNNFIEFPKVEDICNVLKVKEES